MARIARGEEVVDSAMRVIATAVTVEQLRQAQAVVLPLRFAMSLEQTAAVTGLSVGWVSKLRNRFIQGKAVGDGTVLRAEVGATFCHELPGVPALPPSGSWALPRTSCRVTAIRH